MGIIQKLANITKYEVGANYELGNSVNSGVNTIFGQGGDAINVLDEYNGIAWRCINIRAETLADQELMVERLVNKKWQEDPNHEFNDVLEGDEGALDLSELLEAHEKSMCLYGESFWYFSKAESQNKPFAVYLLNPAYMTVYISSNKVTGYVYNQNGEHIPLDLDEIAHFRLSNPRNPFRGLGPMQAAGWFIRSSRYVTTYVNNFLENNAIPPGVIVAKDQVDDADWKLFKQQWSEKHSGINNTGKTGFVRGNIDFVKTGLSLGEVDFEAVKASSRQDIMVMFGISKPMMSIFDDINRASAVTARQLFAITVTSPAMRRLERKLTKKVTKWYGPGYRVAGSNPIPDDEDAELNKYDKLLGRAVTVNEVRSAYGLEKLTGAEYDTILPSVTAKPDPNATPPPKQLKPKIKVKLATKKAEFGYEMKESFRSEAENIQVKYENQFIQKAEPLLKAQEKMVLDQLEPKKLANGRFDAQKEADAMTEATLPLFVSLAEEQGQLAAKFVSSDATFELTDVMKKYIADSVGKAALSFTEDTQQKLADAITAGLEQGEGATKVAQRVKDVYAQVLSSGSGGSAGGGAGTAFDASDGWRAERLARTEIIKTSNEITEAAYKQSGVVEKKEWLANPGACEYCQGLDGSMLSLGSSFVHLNETLEGTDGGTRVNDYDSIDHPPAHPACRCTLIPVIGD